MPDRLPIHVNPEHAATRGFQTSGFLKLGLMEQLLDRLVAPFGEVKVALAFGKDGQRMFLTGKVSGNAVLQCQRCLHTMELEINTHFRLGFIYSEAEIDSLLPDEEPLLIDETNNEALRLANIVEDELELLLPMVARHAEGQCRSNVELISGIEQKDTDQKEQTSKKNPFAVLMDFKKR